VYRVCIESTPIGEEVALAFGPDGLHVEDGAIAHDGTIELDSSRAR
jgi:hypothetical protein